jgi:hypothetical protein
MPIDVALYGLQLACPAPVSGPGKAAQEFALAQPCFVLYDLRPIMLSRGSIRPIQHNQR